MREVCMCPELSSSVLMLSREGDLVAIRELLDIVPTSHLLVLPTTSQTASPQRNYCWLGLPP